LPLWSKFAKGGCLFGDDTILLALALVIALGAGHPASVAVLADSQTDAAEV
jgi:hypothetical protein